MTKCPVMLVHDPGWVRAWSFGAESPPPPPPLLLSHLCVCLHMHVFIHGWGGMCVCMHGVHDYRHVHPCGEKTGGIC